jgi:hypothetical protein
VTLFYDPSGNLVHKAKETPDEKDHVLAALNAKGWTVAMIARHFGDRRQTVNNRMNWLKSRRWMTYDGRMLTAYQRDVMIQREKAFIEVEGVGH